MRGGRVGASDLRVMVLGGCLAGLIWAQAGPQWTTPGSRPETPLAIDPWAESRRSRAILEAQEAAPVGEPDTAGRETVAARRFALCHAGGGTNCVVDGDTFWLDGEKIRIADIDTPETHPPRCAYEAELGDRATRRLRALLNEGALELETIDRDTDRYGRKLRRVVRDGRSLGDVLVGEGLARPYGTGRRSWCDA